ncbi:MAG: hypothetical protein ACRCWB_11700 [Enterovibrio sp.]
MLFKAIFITGGERCQKEERISAATLAAAKRKATKIGGCKRFGDGVIILNEANVFLSHQRCVNGKVVWIDLVWSDLSW